MTGCGAYLTMPPVTVQCGVDCLCPSCAAALQRRVEELEAGAGLDERAFRTLEIKADTLQSRVEELEADLERMRTMDNRAFGLQVKRAEAAERRAEALARYVRHGTGCSRWEAPAAPCDCGLAEALKA